MGVVGIPVGIPHSAFSLVGCSWTLPHEDGKARTRESAHHLGEANWREKRTPLEAMKGRAPPQSPRAAFILYIDALFW